MKQRIPFIIVIATLLLSTGCKKENNGSGLKAVFSYVADGFRVNFTNFSTNATEYSWDFGDGTGTTSSRREPLHIFKQKGDFLVTLTAKNGSETSVFKDTVAILGPNIKIDGDFTDWEYVDYAHRNAEGYNSSITAIKSFVTSDAVNIYLEGNANMNMDIIDIYMDADNNPGTGFATWMYPAGSGADFLLEGSPTAGWGDIFKHAGAPGDWAWNAVGSFTGNLIFSSVVTSGSVKKIEFSIKKSVLGPVKNFVNFAIIESTSGWAEAGKIPESATPASKFIAVPL
ncbi:MAG TPA: PKD domain-containing protein [Ferruginibacter sp.]|nr:PKD domain-containing protein [Ferruginibacter sp.]HMP22320.1 PKD domain-containing protein [Ferruginibacter sp.]